ncbi:MAG TPA: erythromycin esterase family protein [Thermoanaerobaculia bacterium]
MHILTLLLVLLSPGGADTYDVKLRRGQSADVVVQQQGVDVVVELRAPDGTLLDEIDGPTGRNGAERAEIVAATGGTYRVRIRPFDANEPAGNYDIHTTIRSVAETRALLETRRRARAEAAEWLRARRGSIDDVAARARVIGLGEATHGSREFGDARLALTQRLIEQHGFRVVAIEASSTQLDALVPYLRGEAATPAVSDGGWIGVRTRRALIEWIRAWNLAHRDDLVRVIGVDAQENAPARAELGAFLKQAYGELPRWIDAEKEIAAADEQSGVFGDSSVSAASRDTLLAIVARLALDLASLRARYGAAADRALEQARTIAQFADFNSGAADARSRDWYMADAVLRAAGEQGRAVYWAHNAHVTTRGRAAGAQLRAALGCNYAALALTFGSGAFVAQIPNDPEDRLAISSLPQASDESLENVLAADAESLTTWACNLDAATVPQWLRAPHAMHWVGALWTPGSVASSATRPYDLLHDFDGVLYIPRVTADELPANRPLIPARAR